MARTVLGVGHCTADANRLGRAVEKAGGTFANVPTTGQALRHLAADEIALVLPNRVIGLDEEGGVNLIRRMKEDPRLAEIPVMLVSAMDQSQQAAVEAGAERGFGKDELGTGSAVERMQPYLREVTSG